MAYWKKPISIGDALSDYLVKSGLNYRLDEARALQLWREIAGDQIIGITREVHLLHGVLYVHLWSAPWRAILFQQRLEWKKRLNESLGKEIVKDIIFK